MPHPDQITTGKLTPSSPVLPRLCLPQLPTPLATARGCLTGALAGGSLRSLLQQADLTPETLAQRLNTLARELGLSRQMDQKTPYKWLRGSEPRHPWPALTAHILSARLGTPITTQDLGCRTARRTRPAPSPTPAWHCPGPPRRPHRRSSPQPGQTT